MSRRFEITRPDGRSNTAVVLDLVRGVAPGHLFTFADLVQALEAGGGRAYSVTAVRGVVVGASGRLLREQSRALTSVRGVGYRVAAAGEHQGLAVVRTKRADVQMRRGWQLLTHARMDEMTEPQRRAHEGTLMIVGAMYQQQQAMEKRLRAVEQAIRTLVSPSAGA